MNCSRTDRTWRGAAAWSVVRPLSVRLMMAQPVAEVLTFRDDRVCRGFGAYGPEV